MNTYYVELNFSGSNTIDTGIAVSQGDYGKVQLSIACKKDGQFISDAESAEIIFQTEKGKVINGDLTGSGGLYGYVFQGNELQDPGKLVATVTLHYEDGQTSSESFLMAVRYNPLYDQNLQAGPYITQLEKLQAQAQGYVDYIGAIIEQLRQDIGETALTKADLQNDFLQSAPGLKALDAALGPQILQKSNVVNNLLATVTGNVLDATQGKALNEKITQLYSNTAKNQNAVSENPDEILITSIRTINGWSGALRDKIPSQLLSSWIICITTSNYEDIIGESLLQILISSSKPYYAIRGGNTSGKWNAFEVYQMQKDAS